MLTPEKATELLVFAKDQLAIAKQELKDARKEFYKLHGDKFGYWGTVAHHKKIEQFTLLVKMCEHVINGGNPQEYLRSTNGRRQHYKPYEKFGEEIDHQHQTAQVQRDYEESFVKGDVL